ncbi:hypothetical protein EDB85DRAFT_583287 [Lactarius pseudohatsudake]|nr:hypothetical protein EDB85DRAFT_583287 [Lactarius pseudohatsudake]
MRPVPRLVTWSVLCTSLAPGRAPLAMDNVREMVMFDPDMDPHHFNHMGHSYAMLSAAPLSLYPHKGTLHRRDNPGVYQFSDRRKRPRVYQSWTLLACSSP